MTTHTTTEFDLDLGANRTLHVYDTGGAASDLVVFWHHGTPNIGSPPEPLFAASVRLGIRWVSFDRPGYGGSTYWPARDLGSAATCVAAVADALGIERFAVMGHSGGASHALACAALLPDKVTSVVSIAGLAPFGAAGLDWFAGMYPGGKAGLQAALAGRDAKARFEETAEFDPEMFTPADRAALAGPWSWLNSVVEPALDHGPDGLIADDIAYVSPWGADPARISAPALLLHGGQDRIVPSAHGDWLARAIPGSEYWRRTEDGHISILTSAAAALGWLREHDTNEQEQPV